MQNRIIQTFKSMAIDSHNSRNEKVRIENKTIDSTVQSIHYITLHYTTLHYTKVWLLMAIHLIFPRSDYFA